MKIRKATVKDIPGIKKVNKFSRILNQCSPLDKLDSKKKREKDGIDYFRKFIIGKNKWCYVAEENNKVLGFITFNLEKRETWWEIKTVGYVDLVFVDQKFRSKGIAKLLMKEAYKVFRKKKMKYVKLAVQTKNEPAHQMWLKKGFQDFRVDMYKKL